MIRFLSLIFLSLPSLAFSQTIVVQGQSVEARNIETYAGSDQIHSFDLVNPTRFQFANGNSFLAHYKVYLAQSGEISAIVSNQPQVMDWRLGDGKMVKLDCSPIPDGFGNYRSRMVAFHSNGTYYRGCKVPGTGFEFTNDAGSKVVVFDDVEFGPNNNLIYADKVSYGYIYVNGQKVGVGTGSSLGFHENGNPSFFTLISGESFTTEMPGYGSLEFAQKTKARVLTRLFENGQVELGVVSKNLTHKELGLSIPAESGVVFTEFSGSLILTGIVYAEPVKMDVENYNISVAKFFWDLEKGFFNLITSESFTFRLPNEGRTILVPAGSMIGLSGGWKIIGIKVLNDRSGS